MLRIKIPKPCHEDWNAMTPTSRGAFCNACAKDVVDFTTMTDDEVQHYFLDNTGDRVCGRFNNTQLHRIRINIPNHIFYAKIAGWKKFMAVVMLAFGSMLFGCDVTTESALNVSGDSTSFKIDTPNNVVGELSLPSLPPVEKDSIIWTAPYITGDISVCPQEIPVEEPIMGKLMADTAMDTSQQLNVVSKGFQKKDSTNIKSAQDTTDCAGTHFY